MRPLPSMRESTRKMRKRRILLRLVLSVYVRFRLVKQFTHFHAMIVISSTLAALSNGWRQTVCALCVGHSLPFQIINYYHNLYKFMQLVIMLYNRKQLGCLKYNSTLRAVCQSVSPTLGYRRQTLPSKYSCPPWRMLASYSYANIFSVVTPTYLMRSLLTMTLPPTSLLPCGCGV